ncbi:MAG: hypothetical protein JW976_00595 [Syntrophaceae bacterium]|nr:hypothetical protein [Syntrophaceae bacterium]
MRKQFNLLGILGVLALVFIIAGCGEQQKQQSPVEPIIETAKIKLVGPCANDDPSSPVGIVPTLVEGNTPATTSTNVKIDPPNAGTYALGSGSVTITFNSDGFCGEVMEWSVTGNIVIDHVYAKGGNDYNDYDYTGQNPRPTTDGNLHCPINESEKYADFSHVNFVFHEVTTPSYALTISKTAVPEFTRTHKWTIDKTGDPTELTLCEGEAFLVNYTVTVDELLPPVDSDWKVTGTITIKNIAPEGITAQDVVITNISDVLSDGTVATIDCDLSSPITLIANGTLTCTYSAEPTSGIPGTNTVTVVTGTEGVTGGTATADYTFGDPTTVLDECITVSDDKFGPLFDGNEVCIDDGLPKVFNYSLEVQYEEWGLYTFTNVATFTTNDNGTTGSDSWDVAVTVCQCETAWGGNTGVNVGDKRAWWYYFDVLDGSPQTIWAGQYEDVGSVSYIGGNIVISLTGGWELYDPEGEAVKIQGYYEIPSVRPEAGHFDYKGMNLTVPVSEYPYYAIHLDVRRCP